MPAYTLIATIDYILNKQVCTKIKYKQNNILLLFSIGTVYIIYLY